MNLSNKLKQHILLFIGGVIFITATFIAWDLRTGFINSTEAVQQRLETNCTALAEHAFITFNTAESAVNNIHDFLTENNDKDLTEKQIFDYSKNVIRPFSHIGWIDVKDEQARSIANTNEFPVSQKLPHNDIDYIQFHSRNDSVTKLFFSKPAKGKVTNKYRFFISRRLEHLDGSYAGIIGAALDPFYFNSFYKRINYGKTMSMALLRLDGQILMRSPFLEKAIQSFNIYPMLKAELLKSESGVYLNPEAGPQKEKKYVAYRRLEKYRVIAITAISVEEALFPWRYQAAIRVLTTLILSALAVLLGYFIHNSFHKLAKSQQSLYKTEERFKLAMEANRDGLWDWRIEPEGFYCNSRYSSMLGYDSIPEHADSWRNLIHPDDKYKVFNAYDDCIENRCSHFQIEFRMLGKDNKWKWILGRGNATARNDQGKAIRIVGTHTDITEQKLMETALRSSEARFSLFMQNVPGVAFIKDNLGKYIYVNKRMSNLLQLSEEDVIGLSDYDIFPIESASLLTKNDASIMANKKALTVEESGELRGEFVTYATAKFPFPLKDRDSIGIAGIGIDITAIKLARATNIELEKKLQQAQRMEAIGTLAGGIAHDFNNILAGVIGYTEIAKETVSPESSTDSALNEVLKAGHRAADLVKQILAFSRQSTQEFIPVQVHIVVKEAMKLIRASIPSTIDIKYNIDSKSGAVLADPTQIHQIIMNLCTNAYHAMRSDGGIMGVTVQSIQVEQDDIAWNDFVLPPGPYVEIDVSDSGIGMDKNTIENIFMPYFSTKKRGEGTGLGLSVVHGIVKSFGGYITVYSEPQEGTTFRVYLPHLNSDISIERVEKQRSYPTGDERILVVDDEKVLVEMTKMMLTDLGYDVTEISNSRLAFQVFEQNPNSFDLVITDMTMPKMDGAELIQNIRKLRSDIPIILCTGFSELIDKDKASILGIQRYLLKPVIKRDLAMAVREVLNDPSQIC